MQDHLPWERLFRIDTLVSLGVAAVTLLSGVIEGIPWTYRIPAILLAACAGLYLWRQLSMRRLFMPTHLQSVYENDLLDVSELFHGRSIIRNVTFKSVEFTGPATVYIDETCRIPTKIMCNPDDRTLFLYPQKSGSVFPHYRFQDCTFENVIFTQVALIISNSNEHLFFYDDEIRGQKGLFSDNLSQRDTEQRTQP